MFLSFCPLQVVYNKKHHLEYDGSMIPAEWFGWMHYKTDLPPTEKPPVRKRAYLTCGLSVGIVFSAFVGVVDLDMCMVFCFISF